jgi:4-hydroxybenzoate polyprenyltransferase
MLIQNKKNSPLCVDLDGTLVLTDTFYESFFLLLKKNAFYFFYIFIWAFYGKAYLKNKISSIADIDVSILPYNQALISWLKNKKSSRQKIYLTTGASHHIAKKVSKYLGLFDGVISTNKINMTGKNKAKKLTAFFGKNSFDYIGNSFSDIHVWKNSRKIFVSNCSRITRYRLIKENLKISKEFQTIKNDFFMGKYFNAMRPYQWVKNTLIFIPAIVSRQFELIATPNFFLYFLSLCFLCSSVYIFNDLLDLQSDRKHEIKSKRAIASGILMLPSAFFYAIFLGLTSLSLSFFLNKKLFLMQLLYLKCNSIYSLKLKKIFILDCIVLAFLYTTRILIGMVVLNLPISFWLISFSLALFFSLAILKRFSEIKNLKESYHNVPGRNYKLSDSSVLFSLGIFSTLLSLLILIFYFFYMYVNTEIYSRPYLLIVSIAACFFWLLTIWNGALSKEIKYDPILYTFTNKKSIFAVFVFSLSFIFALYS